MPQPEPTQPHDAEDPRDPSDRDAPHDSRAAGRDAEPLTSASARRRIAPVQLESSSAGPKVTLHKDGKVFVYRCATGEEDLLIQRLMEQAQDQNHPLTWFDAARVAHRLGGQLGQRLHRLRFGETTIQGMANRIASNPEDR